MDSNARYYRLITFIQETPKDRHFNECYFNEFYCILILMYLLLYILVLE